MQEDKKVELDEGKHTFHKLRKQLKKDQNEITRIREQDERTRQKIHDQLNTYELALFEAKYIVKRALSLHGKINNSCRKNLNLKKKPRATKQ